MKKIEPHLCHLIANNPGPHVKNISDVTQFRGQEVSSAYPVQNFDIMKNKLINEVLDVKNQCLNCKDPVISSSTIASFTEWPHPKQI